MLFHRKTIGFVTFSHRFFPDKTAIFPIFLKKTTLFPPKNNDFLQTDFFCFGIIS